MVVYPQVHIVKKTGSQDLSAAVLALTTSFARPWRLKEVNIHFSAAVTETVTVTRDEFTGANYDTVLKTEALTSATDFTWRPEGGVLLKRGDEIKVGCTNATATQTAYVTIIGQEEGS